MRHWNRIAPLSDGPLSNLLWQAIVGAWPLDRDRLHAYAEKAVTGGRKLHRAGSTPMSMFERSMHGLVDLAFDDAGLHQSLVAMAARLTVPGWSNALSAKLVQILGPGVPDVYQGTELWENSLVDPDNRRPVDHRIADDLLTRLDDGWQPDVDRSGAVKLLVVSRALRLRRDRSELFNGYTPLTATGAAADHLVAFDRGGVIAAGTRLPIGLAETGGWGSTVLTLPPGGWRDVLHGNASRLLTGSARSARCSITIRWPFWSGKAEIAVDFDVWAPRASSVALVADGDDIPMRQRAGGWWTAAAENPARYGFRLDGAEIPLPDPRSRRQPDGVHELSATFDADAYVWHDKAWTGRPLAGGLIYELHVGTFTPEGTLDAAVDKLDHLVSIGVDFVELLPVNGFNGVHNWGYDGVLWYTVHEPYGGPAAYQRFVDACHARGLAVIQDVVYNHLGASGNYLPQYGPYLHDEHANTWGSSVNLDGPDSDVVRRFIIDNALMWLQDYHVDGLRLDAVHALVDNRAMHLLAELTAEVEVLSAHLGRPLTLIAESDLNDPRLITSREAGGYGLSAQWSDDFHHVLHVALTGETSGYYADFGFDRRDRQGFDRRRSSTTGPIRASATVTTAVRSTPPPRRPPDSWCSRRTTTRSAIGPSATGSPRSWIRPVWLLAAVLVFTSPFTPMLFMGEEWAASTPWQFFTSHPEPELGKATAEGRIAEFAQNGLGSGAWFLIRRRRAHSRTPSWTGRSSTPVSTQRCWSCIAAWPRFVGTGAS